MPRPNKPRAVAYEEQLAQRIRVEREARDLTYERLAEKMTEAGCPIQGSAIFKIEKGDPPRRITVNELMAFSQVFGIRVPELLVSAELASRKAALAAFETYAELVAERARMIQELDKRIAAAASKVRKAVDGSEPAALALEAELVRRFGRKSHWVDDMLEVLRGEH